LLLILPRLERLSQIVGILKVEEQTIKDAFASDFPDFEDSIQYFSPLYSKKIDVIITRNTNDYKKSDITVMTPGNYLKTASS
jgi:hypothetical protein